MREQYDDEHRLTTLRRTTFEWARANRSAAIDVARVFVRGRDVEQWGPGENDSRFALRDAGVHLDASEYPRFASLLSDLGFVPVGGVYVFEPSNPRHRAIMSWVALAVREVHHHLDGEDGALYPDTHSPEPEAAQWERLALRDMEADMASKL